MLHSGAFKLGACAPLLSCLPACLHAWWGHPRTGNKQQGRELGERPKYERPHLQKGAQVLQVPLNLLLAQGQVVLAILALRLRLGRGRKSMRSGAQEWARSRLQWARVWVVGSRQQRASGVATPAAAMHSAGVHAGASLIHSSPVLLPLHGRPGRRRIHARWAAGSHRSACAGRLTPISGR